MEEALERIRKTVQICDWDEVNTDLIDLAEKVNTERINHLLRLFVNR